MILTRAPLADRLPIEPAAMAGRVVVQRNKDGLEEVGLIKIDLLGLRRLAAPTEASTLVGATTGSVPDLDRLTFDDSTVYEGLAIHPLVDDLWHR